MEYRASLTADSVVAVDIENVGKIPATIIGDSRAGVPSVTSPLSLRLSFDWTDMQQRERMIVKLFASGAHPAGLRRVSNLHILLATWRRLFGVTWLDRARPRPVVGGTSAR
jgi:hypothetical protein